MRKDKLSSLVLVLFILSLFGTVSVFMQYAEPSPLAYSIFVVPVVLGVLLVKLRMDVRKDREAAARAAQQEKQAREDAQRRARELEEERRKVDRERFRHERFTVAGVTFKNEDGNDRQKILREIALNNDGRCEVWFNESEDLGEDSGISVLTELGCVGFIRRSDKTKVRRFFDKKAQVIYLSVEHFEADDGQKIYRADVVITMCRDDPDQAWYFDDLQ